VIDVAQIVLGVAAFWCFVCWLVLAIRSVRTGADVEVETYHLGVCLILAIGFCGLIEAITRWLPE